MTSKQKKVIKNPYVPPLNPEGKLSVLLGSGQREAEQRLHPSSRELAKQPSSSRHWPTKHLPTNLPIHRLCLSSAFSYLEKLGTSSVWHSAVAGGATLEAGAQVQPRVAAEEVAGSESLEDSQAAQPVVTAAVIWKLTWTVRWKIWF